MKLSEKSLKVLRANLLEIAPEAAAVLNDIADSEKRKALADGAGSLAVLEDYINLAIVRRYDNFVKILAVIYELTESEIEEKSVAELADMVVETLSDKLLLRFFPRLRRLGLKTQSDL